MNGIVVIDKPTDLTSARLTARVKKSLKAKKVGHTGTLDPFATGVVVCCIDQATRLARFLMHGKKRYEAVMCLGIRTDTQDLEGRVISRQPELAVTDQQINSAFGHFANIKEQNPPAFSALKHHGVPLYRLARKGTLVQKPPRPISIYELKILHINLPHVRFEVVCSQGTYIRTLCDDIGEFLGCGAHLLQLRRTENSGFTLDDAASLNEFEALAASGRASTVILPMSDALKNMPRVTADRTLAEKIQYGKPVARDELALSDGCGSAWIKVVDTQQNLMAVLSSSRENGVYPYACVFSNNR